MKQIPLAIGPEPARTFDNFLPVSQKGDRRQALWTVLALLKDKNTNSIISRPDDQMIPMTGFEKVVADYKTLNMTTDNHPMKFCPQKPSTAKGFCLPHPRRRNRHG